jgi:hypothetical protein
MFKTRQFGSEPVRTASLYAVEESGRVEDFQNELENLDFALQMFDQAIKLDPNFALAHAGVANVCGLIYELRERSQFWMDKGIASCDRAAALEPQLAEVAVVRARSAKEVRRRNPLRTSSPRAQVRLRRRVQRAGPGLFRFRALPGSGRTGGSRARGERR